MYHTIHLTVSRDQINSTRSKIGFTEDAPPAMGDSDDDGQQSARNDHGDGEGAALTVRMVEG